MQKLLPDPILIRKYNRPVPRYTSYPTVPNWKDQLAICDWTHAFQAGFEEQNRVDGIALYIHLPFCESLCTYCGCNKRITTNHSVETEYLDVLQKEWRQYRRLMNDQPLIRELHLGGGTPTFFSPENLEKLISILTHDAQLHPDFEFSIEGHPNNTTVDHLAMLYRLGFRRISYGVQDLDAEVQRVINRIQPFEILEAATDNARKIGFDSVNFDLIYGLPRQTIQSIETTISAVLSLKPDRIAFYSYAHVPWTSRAQRLFDESDLPDAELKLQLYIKGKQMLAAAGYMDIGMDHFALPDDSLYLARQQGKLHRNFMGYTTKSSGILIGLGVSAISDTGTAFAQNAKTLHDYYAAINAGNLAIQKGWLLTKQDAIFRQYILDISCRGETFFWAEDLPGLRKHVFPKLCELQADGLISWNESGLQLTDQGHYFIRNICSAFDLYLEANQQNPTTFSKAI